MLFEILCFQQDTFFRRFMINDINKKKKCIFNYSKIKII